MVSPIVIRGNINYPAKIDLDLKNSNIKCNGGANLSLAKLLVIQEFGPHDRGVAVKVQSEERALHEIRRGIRDTHPGALKTALEQLGVPGAEIPQDEDSLTKLVASQFTVPFSSKGKLVPSVVGGADLVAFFREWAEFAYGLIAIDLHTLRTAGRAEESVPDDPNGHRRPSRGRSGHSRPP